MKVLLLTDADIFAGTERHILELAMSLRQLEIDVIIGCPSPSPLAAKAVAAKLYTVVLQRTHRESWRTVSRLRSLLRRGQVDIIHAHNGRTALLATLAVKMARRGKLVVTQHFLHTANEGRSPIKRKLFSLAHGAVNRNVDRFIAVSQAVKEQMVFRGDVAVEKIVVIHNGMSSPERATMGPRASVRAELGIAETEMIILCVARLDPEKNVGSLIEAMELVSQADPSARCLVAGEGALQSRLQSRIELSKSPAATRLLGFRSDVLSLINACDMLALPSLVESFGLVLLEAMSLGKAVVATRCGGPVEIVDDGVTGFLVEPQSPSALAAALTKMLASDEQRTLMGAAGLQRYRQLFSAKMMADRTHSLYSSLVR